jgi:hypothetical protein
MVPLGDIAQVSLGYKSLQNDFFYLNQATIDTFKIEADYLQPIARFKDLDAKSFRQDIENRTFLFHCRKDDGDLRGTGALRYVRTMAAHSANQKKQSGKVISIREALEAQGGGLWYAPKATPHAARLWLRKAFNGLYAPFVFANPTVVDQRCNYLDPKEGIGWELLGAVLTSTIFAFSLEINGSVSMGAGALEAPTTKLRMYPVFDPRTLTSSEKKELVTRARAVWRDERPLDWLAGPQPGPNLQALDSWLLDRADSGVTIRALYADLGEACRARIAVAQDKARAAKKRDVDNLTSVADGIADLVRQHLNARQFPDNFLAEDTPTQPFTVDRKLLRHIRLLPLLDQSTLTLTTATGKALIDRTFSKPVAEAVVRAVLMGRSSFDIPTDRTAAEEAVSTFLAWFDGIRRRLQSAISESAFGTGYEDRLAAAVYGRLGIDPLAGAPTLPAEINLAPPRPLPSPNPVRDRVRQD